jgi:arylsulfatase A-like enzyme
MTNQIRGLLVLAGLLWTSGFLNAQLCDVPPDYEAFWTFDQQHGLADASVNGHDPSGLHGNYSFEGKDYQQGNQSFRLEGNAFIAYDDSAFMHSDFGNRTILFRIRPDHVTGVQTLFEEGGKSAGLGIRLFGCELQARLRIQSYLLEVESSFPFDNWWHSVAVSVDPQDGILRLFLDGILVDSAVSQALPLPSLPDMDPGGIGATVGKDCFGERQGNYYKGLIDGVLYYTRRLGRITIQSISKAYCRDNPPNIILLMADDLGWGDTRYNGSYFRTPSLDSMAKAGLQFNRFYTAGPVCSPTRASCLTGRHPIRSGIDYANEGMLPPSETVLPEILKEAGFRTGFFGKWHLGSMTQLVVDGSRGGPGTTVFSPPWLHGFETIFATENKVPTFDPMKHPNSTTYPISFSDSSYYGTAYWTGPSGGGTEGNRTALNNNLSGDDSRVVMDRVLPFIDSATVSQIPFFAVVWFHTPHIPVIYDDEFRPLYNGGVWNGLTGAEKRFGNAVSALDAQIGRLRDYLAQKGVADNTLIWFCSDNGPMEGEPTSAGPFRGYKRELYEGGIRVPAILEWPGKIMPGQTTDLPVVTTDFLATITDWLGLRNPSVLPQDGFNLRDQIEGGLSERGIPIGFRSENHKALITDCYKLVSAYGGAFELYDMVSDPYETSNLAPLLPAIYNALIGEYEAWELAVDSGMPYVPGWTTDGSCTPSTGILPGPGGNEPIISMFPNPTQGCFTVSFSGMESGLLRLRIIDMAGRVVFRQERQVAEGANQIVLEPDQLPTGTYLLSFELKDVHRVHRFLKH